MTGEQNTWNAGQAEIGREFQSVENDKLRAFQERMAEMDRANQRRMGRGQGSGLGDIAGMAAGYFTGGLGAGLGQKAVDKWF
jgi:hypothetical protein